MASTPWVVPDTIALRADNIGTRKKWFHKHRPGVSAFDVSTLGTGEPPRRLVKCLDCGAVGEVKYGQAAI